LKAYTSIGLLIHAAYKPKQWNKCTKTVVHHADTIN
jgi:hypothetical protein